MYILREMHLPENQLLAWSYVVVLHVILKKPGKFTDNQAKSQSSKVTKITNLYRSCHNERQFNRSYKHKRRQNEQEWLDCTAIIVACVVYFDLLTLNRNYSFFFPVLVNDFNERNLSIDPYINNSISILYSS